MMYTLFKYLILLLYLFFNKKKEKFSVKLDLIN